jgi:hypothetical protein
MKPTKIWTCFYCRITNQFQNKYSNLQLKLTLEFWDTSINRTAKHNLCIKGVTYSYTGC